jgi:hypothetical protein
MADEESPIPDEVLTSAKEQLDEEELSLADNEETLHALSELTPVYENDRSYSVLGNYGREPIRRLNLVVDRLNRRTDAYAFRMVDVRGEWDNSIQKFCLVADIVTYLVGVAEKKPSDFLVELGLLVGTVEYFSKSHVLIRTVVILYRRSEAQLTYRTVTRPYFDSLAENGYNGPYQTGVRRRGAPLRLDAGRRLRTVRPRGSTLPLADRNRTGCRDWGTSVTGDSAVTGRN